MKDNKWIDNLKKGDYVVITGTRVPDNIGIYDRSTKTQIILKNGSKFRKDDCREVGASGWSSYSIEEATQEKLDKIRNERKRSTNILYLKSLRLDLLADEKIEEMVRIAKS